MDIPDNVPVVEELGIAELYEKCSVDESEPTSGAWRRDLPGFGQTQPACFDMWSLIGHTSDAERLLRELCSGDGLIFIHGGLWYFHASNEESLRDLHSAMAVQLAFALNDDMIVEETKDWLGVPQGLRIFRVRI